MFEEDWIEIVCPSCGIETSVSLWSVKTEASFLCRGCHCTIRIEEQEGSFGRAIQETEELLRNLFKS